MKTRSVAASARRRPILLGVVVLLAAAQINCSVVLTKGPPRPGDDRYDASGAYPDGVPCTTSRMWPLVDTGLLLWVLIVTANYPADQTDDRIDGLLTAAGAALSAWIGYRRTNACRELERDLMTPTSGALGPDALGRS